MFYKDTPDHWTAFESLLVDFLLFYLFYGYLNTNFTIVTSVGGLYTDVLAKYLLPAEPCRGVLPQSRKFVRIQSSGGNPKILAKIASSFESR